MPKDGGTMSYFAMACMATGNTYALEYPVGEVPKGRTGFLILRRLARHFERRGVGSNLANKRYSSMFLLSINFSFSILLLGKINTQWHRALGTLKFFITQLGIQQVTRLK